MSVIVIKLKRKKYVGVNVLFSSFLLDPVVNCTDPGIPANSIRESKIEHGNFTFGSVVFYDCNPGYYLFGSSVLTCQPVGHWDRPLPECIGTVVASFNCYVTCPLSVHCPTHLSVLLIRLTRDAGK